MQSINKPMNSNDTEPAYRIKGNNMSNKNGQVINNSNSVGNKSYPTNSQSKYRYRAVSKSRA